MLKNINYGVDGPVEIRKLSIIILTSLLLGVAFYYYFKSWHSIIMISDLIICSAALSCILLMYFSSKIGKYWVWQKLLRQISFNGDETILDVACGYGLVLNLAAKHLPNGLAIGIDLWCTRDQFNNAPNHPLENAAIMGVSKQTKVVTAGMRKLAFADQSFDLILSSKAVHKVRGRDNRRQTLQEMYRVLKPGGKLIIVDSWFTQQYQQDLSALGFCENTTWVSLNGKQLN